MYQFLALTLRSLPLNYCLCYLFSLLFRPSLLKALDVQIKKISGFLVSFEIENKRTIWLLVKASLMFMIMVQ